MKNRYIQIFSFLVSLLSFTTFSACEVGDEINFGNRITLPTVITHTVTQITGTSAVVGGKVTSDGNASVTERGVCIATDSTSYTQIASGSGLGACTCNLTDLQPNTTYFVRAYAVNSEGTAYGKQVTFTTNGIEGTHEYVDLGLSVKWATMNVGANTPEDYGDYFSWGEIEPKDEYSLMTYKYFDWNGSGGLTGGLTKYNTNNNYGTVDNKIQLELGDDAARADWGGSWRMPTDAELTELREQCRWTWKNQNGVRGYKVTSMSNGNSIFLPAAGFRSGWSLFVAGDYGYYWSSSLNTDDSEFAWGVIFDVSIVDRLDGNRVHFGYSVRPVCR